MSNQQTNMDNIEEQQTDIEIKHVEEKIPYVDIKSYQKNKKHIIKEGAKIYKENDYLSKIWDIMSDNTFSEFFDSYLLNYNDVQVAMVFFNIYKNVKEQYQNIFHRPIRKEEMVFILRQIMRNNFMRKYMIQNTKDNNLIKLNSDVLKDDVKNIIQNNKEQLYIDLK
jgi:hypothetical protein